MIAVVEVEVEGQRQNSVLSSHRLSFESEGRELLAQGVKLGLIVGSFQDINVLMPQNYKLCPKYHAKFIILQYGLR